MDASSELDSLLDVNDKQATNDSLDDLLNHTEEDVEFRPKQNKKPKRIKSFRKSAKLPETAKSNAVQDPTSKMDRSEACASLVEDKAGSSTKLDDLTEVILEHSVSNNSKQPQFECSNTIPETAIQAIGEDHVSCISKEYDKIEQNEVQDATFPSTKNGVEINDIQDKDNEQANNEDDTILDINVDHVKDGSLDDLLNPDENDSVLSPEKSKKPKRIKSFRKSIKGSKDEGNKAMASIDEKYKTTNKDKAVEECESNSSQNDTKTGLSSLPNLSPENLELKDVERKEKSETKYSGTVAASKISDELSSNSMTKQVENVNPDMFEIKSTSKETEPKPNTLHDEEKSANITTGYIEDETVNIKGAKIIIHENKPLTQGNLLSVGKNYEPSIGQPEFEKEESELDMLKENNEFAFEDSLDDILKPTEDDVMSKKQSIKPKRIKSFRKSLKAPIKIKEKSSGSEDTKSMKTESSEGDNQIAMFGTNNNAKQEYAEESFLHEISPTEQDKSIELEQELLSGEKGTVPPEVPQENTSNETFNDTTNANENDIEKQSHPVSCEEKLDDTLTSSKSDAPNGLDHIESKSHEKPFDSVSKELTPERVKENETKGKVEVNDRILKPKPPKRIKSIRKSKVFIDDDYDPFAPEVQNSITYKEGTKDVDQSLDFLLDAQPIDTALESSLGKQIDSSSTEFISENEAPSRSKVTLEEIVAISDKKSTDADTVKPKTLKRPKRVKSIRKSKIFIDEDYDPFAPNVQSSEIDQGGLNDVDPSLDSLLDVQPRDDVQEIDHLMSLDTTTRGTSTFDSSHSQQGNVKSSGEKVDLNLLVDTVTQRTNGPEVADDVTDGSFQMSERQDGEKKDKETNIGNEELNSKESSEINSAHNLSRRNGESEANKSFEASPEVKANQIEGDIGMNDDSFDNLNRTFLDQPKEKSAHIDDIDTLVIPDEAGAEDSKVVGVFPTKSPEKGEIHDILTEAIINRKIEEVHQSPQMCIS